MATSSLIAEQLEAAATLALRRKDAAHDRCEFIELCSRDNRGKQIKQSGIHRAWHGHIEWCWAHGLHPVVISPWGQGKSFQLAVETPVWALGRWPWLRITVVCNIEKNAKLRVAASARTIRARPATQMVYPLLYIPGVHSVYSFSVYGSGGTKVDPSFQAWGVFGAGVGIRSDLMIFDDVVDQTNAIKNPILRSSVINYIDTVWMSRLTPPCLACGGSGVKGGLAAWERGSRRPCPVCLGTGGGRTLSIGTMWHREDHWHRCLRTPGYCTLLQRVNPQKTGYTSEVYGIPDGARYPSLDELIVLGSPRSDRDELLGRLAVDQAAKHAEEVELGMHVAMSTGQDAKVTIEVDPFALVEGSSLNAQRAGW